MSELRDVAAALKVIGNRLTAHEECLLVILRNSEQERSWRHEQKNKDQAVSLRYEEMHQKTVESVRQAEDFQGRLWKWLTELQQEIRTLAATRHDDVRVISQRVRKLEEKGGDDEVTRA